MKMNMKPHIWKLLLAAVSMFMAVTAAAQTPPTTNPQTDDRIRGRLIDTTGMPVAGAAVVLFDQDSTFINAVSSASDGKFELHSSLRPYMLQIQHLAYELRTVESDRSDLGDIILKENSVAMNAVVVEGERPVVKVEQGKLSYDLERLTEGQAVNNAYEALTRLPGVSEQSGVLSLAGSSTVTVILNGRPSTMTAEQLATLLRSTPVNRVEKAEVMYSAPPR